MNQFGSPITRSQQPNAYGGTEVTAKIMLHDEDTPYIVKIRSSNFHPNVTLRQLKEKCPVPDTNAYSFFFLTSDREYMFEENENAILPVLTDKKGPMITVKLKPRAQKTQKQ